MSGRMVAVIGTAGRDKTRPMDARLWAAMLEDLRGRVLEQDTLVSGGAAWADHLAVAAFLRGWVTGLQLFLPAPFDNAAVKPAFVAMGGRSSGGVANYYHGLFRSTAGVDGLADLAQAVSAGAAVHAQPAAPGFGGMFARNRLVAQAVSHAIAYTWGVAQPEDGGTRDTWLKMAHAAREHVSLIELATTGEQARPTEPRPRG